MSRARSGSSRVLAALAVAAFAYHVANVAFTGVPLREAALAGALLAGDLSGAADPMNYDLGSSRLQIAKEVAAGGKVGGGLDGTYTESGQISKKDLIQDDKSIAADQRFEENFDQYIGVFAILF